MFCVAESLYLPDNIGHASYKVGFRPLVRLKKETKLKPSSISGYNYELSIN